MESVKLIINGEERLVPSGARLWDVLNEGIDRNDYNANPVVAALVNGEFKSLHYTCFHKRTTVSPVRLFSPLGKRVYRHSICFLLSYSVSKLFPENHLEIGHSLGDGYYYKFSDRTATDDDIRKIADLMRETVSKALPIDREKMPYTEAVTHFTGRQFKHAAELLGCRNDGDITVYHLDGYHDFAYEPLAPCTSVLSLWELAPYQDGMLLRYPQSRDYGRIKDFQDNPLLFSVFRETMENNRILRTESLGELNQAITEGRTAELIQLSEAMFNSKVTRIAREIKDSGTVKMVFIAGPSSSGKTTFSLKLGQQLKILGLKPIKISLDNYYYSRENVPVDEDGQKDYECLEAIDTPLIAENLRDLSEGRPVVLPEFSFRENARSWQDHETLMDENSVLVIEGIHGLNPALAPGLDPALSYKIYISALTSMIIDDHNRISTTDNRIIRRIVRDHRTRGVKTEETLSMWPSVERGEKNHIFPFQNNADVMVNSAMPYELSALAPQALNLLRTVKPDSEYAYATSRRLLKFLELFYTIPLEDIPADSITREFLGGSVFGAI